MKSLAVILGLSLSACAPITPGPQTQLDLAKSEYVAEQLYAQAGATYEAALPAMSPTVKAKAKGVLLQILDCSNTSPPTCTGYLQLARNAMKAADAQTLASEVAQVTSLAGQVTALVKGN